MKYRTLSAGAAVIVLAMALFLGGMAARGVAAPEPKPVEVAPMPGPAELSATFSRIAESVKPGVVNINTESTPKVARRRGGSDPFEEFFGRQFGFGPNQQQQQPQRQRSLGSGVLIDRAGYIVTNHHVVDGADRVRVKFAGDTKQYDAKVIGSDAETDLAVVKIDAPRQLTPVAFGNSDGTKVGDWVLAVGSPFGLDQTVTAGIISAKGRDLPGSQFQQFLQTDAAINHGNSGGPLVNMAGQIVGINTMMLSSRNSWEGVGFALPSNLVVKVYNQLVRDGKVRRGSIGIDFGSDPDSTAALLRSFGATEGVVVNNVRPGGPAEKAGLRSGDVIVAVNGNAVRNGEALVAAVSETAPGTSIRIKYLRDKKPVEASVIVADRAEMYAARDDDDEPSAAPAEPSSAKFGIELQELTPQIAQRLGADMSGVLVRSVQPGSFADDIGLQPNDIIVELQRQPVRSVAEVRNVQQGLKTGQDVVMKVARRNARGQFQMVFLAGTLGQ